MENTKKVCYGECMEKNDESFAMAILRGYKKQFNITVSVLSAIIVILLGYITYDLYIDSQYETIEYVQDGQGYNNINTGTQGDVINGTTDEVQTQEEP